MTQDARGAATAASSPTIHRVRALDLRVVPWRWRFADERRDQIAAHFEACRAKVPQIWNGPILLGCSRALSGETLSASYFQTDFASFLAWRDWGFPDTSVFNGFGMGALRASDGAYVLGVMGPHTANAGRVYFAAGTPDLSDVAGDRLDIPGSVAREVEEEIGLVPSDYEAAPDWHVVIDHTRIAMMRVLRSPLSGAELKRKIEETLAGQVAPELSAIRLVYGPQDFTGAMPGFVTAFLIHMFSAPDGARDL